MFSFIFVLCSLLWTLVFYVVYQFESCFGYDSKLSRVMTGLLLYYESILYCAQTSI